MNTAERIAARWLGAKGKYPLYTVQRVRSKSGKPYGPIHWAENEDKTLCGKGVDENWTILSNDGRAKANCKACIKARGKTAKAIGPYEDSVIDGIKVTQVNTDNRRSKAKIKGNKLLILWGMDADNYVKQKYLPKWVRWGKKHLEGKKQRVEQRKDWTRTVINGYSVYDVEGKEEVAAIMGRIERDVKPLAKEFGLRWKKMKESVAEGSLGFNRGGGGVIALNVRQKKNPMKLRKYSAVMRTMIHEMAHIRFMNHRREFHDFDRELLDWARKHNIYRPG